jgi:hypothetical protein
MVRCPSESLVDCFLLEDLAVDSEEGQKRDIERLVGTV